MCDARDEAPAPATYGFVLAVHPTSYRRVWERPPASRGWGSCAAASLTLPFLHRDAPGQPAASWRLTPTRVAGDATCWTPTTLASWSGGPGAVKPTRIGQHAVMTDGCSGQVRRPDSGRGRWTSFVAAEPAPGGRSRGLHEQTNGRHRVRVGHDNHTVLVLISDEEGTGWTTLALDRATRSWALTQRDRQLDAAASACAALYRG